MTSKLTREQLHERARENVKALKMASRQHAFESAREEILADLQLAELALAAMDSEPVAVPDHLTYLQNPTLENVLSDAEENSPMSHAARILAREVKFWRSAPLYRHAQPAPVVPDENVSFHRLPGESEYDRLNRQREWMESKSKLAKVTAAAPDDLTERLLRLRAQATLDGSYLDTEEWDSLACDVIKALNACRSAMLQDEPVTTANKLPFEQWLSQQTGTIDVECGCVMTEVFFYWLRVAYAAGNSPEQGESRCSTKGAPALDSSSKDAESRCGNFPVIPDTWIPVSEQMPESNGVYFGWDGKRVLEVNCFFGGWSANQFIHGEITHWMPLPSAPQEEKQ